MLKTRPLKEFLDAHDARLTKRLGQHHLVDAHAIARALSPLTLLPGETVVEIGPGLGALTEPLAKRWAHVIAVELDRKMAELLRQRLQAYPQVEVICQDFLAYAWPSGPLVTVVGAIPYQVTSDILIALCAHRARIRQALLIMQKEVAARLGAGPGTKAYGRLSLLMQYSWQVKRVCEIPRTAFYPSPRVDSTCVHLLPHASPPVAVRDEAAMFALIKAGFAQRRKTLLNSAKAAYPELPQALARAGLSPMIRAEALSLPQFAALTNELALR